MLNAKHILQRADLQQLRALLLEGIELDAKDTRSYEERLQQEERPIYHLLEQTFTDEGALDSAVEKLSGALLANECVYMELGMRAGARVLFELLLGEAKL